MGLVNNQRAYDKHLLWQGGEGNIVVGDSVVGFRFPVRIPNFRGNYLSCIEEFSFALDGQALDPDKIELVLNGKRFRIGDLPQLFAEYWYVLDVGIIEVLHDGGLQGKHRIDAAMKLRYGYSAYFGVCKVVTSKCSKEYEF
jgi:hypothetical protein